VQLVYECNPLFPEREAGQENPYNSCFSVIRLNLYFCKKERKNKMNTIELKQNFHHLIDSIDNEKLLINFYELIKTRSSAKEGQLWNKLTDQEQKELLLSLEESKNPENLISHDEMVKKHKLQSLSK
jgi:hypothetical protein